MQGRQRYMSSRVYRAFPRLPPDYGNELGMTLSGGRLPFGTPPIWPPVPGPSPYVEEIDLNSDGVAMINPGGITKFCLRLDGDIMASVPSRQQFLLISHWVRLPRCGSHGYTY